MLATGEILLVDDKANVLRLYNPQGRPIQRIGREGQGPGEFRRPLAAVEDPRSRLVVAEANPRLQVFERGRDGFHVVRSVALPAELLDLCFLGSQLAAHGVPPAHPGLISLLDTTDRVIRSFGEIYHSPSPIVTEGMGYGAIACGTVDSLVYYAPVSLLAEVRAYASYGHPRWRTVFTGTRRNRVEDMPNGGRKITVSLDGVHSLHSLVLIPGEGLLVQYTYRTYDQLQERASYGTIISFLLDPRTGEPHPLGTSLPPIRAANDSEVLIAYEDPVPRFEVRGFRVVKGQ